MIPQKDIICLLPYILHIESEFLSEVVFGFLSARDFTIFFDSELLQLKIFQKLHETMHTRINIVSTISKTILFQCVLSCGRPPIAQQ